MNIDNTINFKIATREMAEKYIQELNEVARNACADERDEIEDFIKSEGKRMQRELNEKTDEDYDAGAAEHVKQLTAQTPAQEATYKSVQRMEYTVAGEDMDDIVVLSRQEYVFQFKAQARNTARAALEMCRLVYCAHKSLSETDFMTFCQNVGYKDDSSTIRKFITIGKVYPRLIDYAEQLPIAWTSIYQLTQMPADDFQRCIDDKYAFNKLTGSELKALVDKTKDANDIVSPFKRDKKINAYRVGTVFFTKLPDDTDFRLLQKAFDEVSARLPVRLVLSKEVTERFANRRAQRYELLKQEDDSVAVKPQEWDYGSAANDVHKLRKAA
jgi:hypothetical protein